MEKIREIVRQYLIILRKQHNLTQNELASQINFSDKTVSRWESGESLPDYETLEALCKLYHVDFVFLFTEHTDEKVLHVAKTRLVFLLILSIIAIWMIAVSVFVTIIMVKKVSYWQAFIWALPTTSLLLIAYNYKFYYNKAIFFLSHTLFVWTILTAFYCQFITSNPWPIFLVGIPIQAAIVTLTIIMFEKRS